MDDILASAYTWFLDSHQQDADGTLTVQIVEGFLGQESIQLDVVEASLGPCLPVTIEPESRYVKIMFEDVRAVLAYPESYGIQDPALRSDQNRYLKRVEASSFRDFVASRLIAIDECYGEFSEWLIWTEDLMLQVVAGCEPSIHLEEGE